MATLREPGRLGVVQPAGPAAYFAGAVVVEGEAGSGAAAGADEPGDPGAEVNAPLGTGI